MKMHLLCLPMVVIFVCGSQPSGSREAEGDLKQTLKAVAALFKTPEEKSVNLR